MEPEASPTFSSDGGATRVVRGVDEVMRVGFEIVRNVREELCVYADENAPSLNFGVDAYAGSYLAMHARGVRVRFITQVVPENMEYCRRMVEEQGVELRHAPYAITGYFAVADKREFTASSQTSPVNPIPYILYSDARDLCVQYHKLFDSLWSSAIPAENRILELERGVEPIQTKVINDPKEAYETVASMIRRAAARPAGGSFLHGVSDKDDPKKGDRFLSLMNALLQDQPDFDVRYVTDIQEENAESVRSLVRAGIAVRHIEGNTIKFTVSRDEYLNHHGGARGSSPTSSVAGRDSRKVPTDGTTGRGLELVWSNNPDLVAQMQHIFLVLWEKATPAEVRLREIETGARTLKTEIICGAEETTAVIARAVARARRSICTIAESTAPSVVVEVGSLYKLTQESASRGVRVRYITEITRENVAYCRRMMDELSIEVRHLGRVKGNLSITEAEYVRAGEVRPGEPLQELVYSNMPDVVEQGQFLFDTLWDTAIPAQIRVMELEKGEELGETRISFSTEEIFQSANRFVDDMKGEALVLFAQEGSINRNYDFFQRIARKARATGARVRLLGRFSEGEMELIRGFRMGGVQVRKLAPGRISNLALGIYDRRSMGLVQYIYPDSVGGTAAQAYLSGVISTNRQTVEGIAAIFDSLWEESELREKEMRARRMAELLQDILAHDIRNYNQIVLLNAEMLRTIGELTTEESRGFLDSIVKAIDQSSALIDRAKRLGKILTQDYTRLRRIDLEASLQRSLSVVRAAYPHKTISQTGLVFANEASERPMVIADELLDEVFTNVLSNSVKYTEGDQVNVEFKLEEDKRDGSETASGTLRSRADNERATRFWKMSIADHGKGIPDELKEGVFTRYLRTAKGSGLGLSIVSALVDERYSGKVKVKDRVKDDHSRGTVVELWLPRAPAE